MDQTTISQFFVARKSSFSSSLPPAKRVKLDGEKVEKNVCRNRSILKKGGRKSKQQQSKSKNTVTGNIKSKTISFGQSDSLDGKPPKEIETSDIPGKTGKMGSNSAAVVEKRNNDRRVNPAACIKSFPKPKIIIEEENSLDEVQTTDQLTKSILYSRGSKILKAGYDKNLIKSPSKVSEILSSPQKNTYSVIGSPTKVLKTPTKLSQVLKSLTPQKEVIGSPSNKVLKTPTKLSEVLILLTPQKEVLKTDESKAKSNAVQEPTQKLNNSESTMAAPRRERLRNKFKHLIQPEKTECNVTTSPDCSATENVCVVQEPDKSFKERSYKKFNYLTQKAAGSGFVLPQKFKILIEMFRCVDSISYLLNQRLEVCTFEKLKKSVETMSSKNFDMKHLAKIKTVYPNGFVFRQEKGLRSSQGGVSKSYQLTIEANFKESMVTSSKQITSNVLITRRLKFENNLLGVVREHHDNFLRKLGMKINNSQIHRWHPRFKVDEVPDVELSFLPQPPVTKDFRSAADLIYNNKGNLSSKVHNVLYNIANKNTDQKANTNNDSENIESNNTIIAAPERNTSTNSKLKGVSSSILERIRQKEQNKMQLAMTRDPETEEKISKLQRLPEMCRILKSYFTTEKKAAITMEDCVQKLLQSYGASISQGYVEDHIRLLSSLVPEWLTIAMVRKFPYVKLSKVYDINKVLISLENYRKKESEK